MHLTGSLAGRNWRGTVASSGRTDESGPGEPRAGPDHLMDRARLHARGRGSVTLRQQNGRRADGPTLSVTEGSRVRRGDLPRMASRPANCGPT